jgi:ComF family protein
MLCEQLLPWVRGCCRLCSRPLPIAGTVCGQCLIDPPLARTLCALEYRGLGRELILSFKFSLRFELGVTLSQVLADVLREETWHDCLLVPVPPAAVRRHERGFSPAAEICIGLGKRLDLPFDIFGLRRHGTFVAQSSISGARERRRNVRNMFSTSLNEISRVVLVDDVVTTGATAQACARVLLSTGVSEVLVVAVCRA